MSENNPTVWVDNIARWHASVPITNDWRSDELSAYEMIAAAIAAEGIRHPDYPLRIARVNITNHGTVVYGER